MPKAIRRLHQNAPRHEAIWTRRGSALALARGTVALARFVTTGMARLLRSRRGKDLAAFLIIPIFALYEAFAQVTFEGMYCRADIAADVPDGS